MNSPIQKQQFPPLSIWLIFGLSATLMLLGLYWFVFSYNARTKASAEERFETRMVHLEKAWKQDTTKHKVLVLGNSLVRAAIAPVDYFRQHPLGHNASVYKIWENGAEFPDFLNRGGLLDRMLALQPDLLLIEETMIAWERPAKKRPLISHITATSNELRHILFGPKVDPEELKKLVAINTFDFEHPDHHQQIQNYDFDGNPVWAPRSKPLPSAWEKDWIPSLKSRGIPTAILHIPRIEVLDKAIHSGERQAYLEELTQELKQLHQIDYWRMQIPTQEIHYRDRAHLNAVGMQLYSDYLLKKISAEWSY